jgi:energy-coupling factor transport system permease protein
MERYHPIVIFLYFSMVLGFGMFFTHPLCLAISLSGGVCFALRLFGWRRAGKGFAGVLVIMLLTAVINPAFSHQGVTVLATLPTGNLLTLESIFYGIGAACMLGAVLIWFRCVSEILTSDKIVYLFGKGFPVLGLLLSMVLGFIPKMQKKLHEINRARSGEVNGGKKWHYIRHGVENLSILITWALEDAVETADSMKGRGYGLAGRTAFTTYRFTRRDVRMTVVLVAELIYLLVGKLNGALYWEYYPQVEMNEWNVYTVSVFVVYGILNFWVVVCS